MDVDPEVLCTPRAARGYGIVSRHVDCEPEGYGNLTVSGFLESDSLPGMAFPKRNTLLILPLSLCLLTLATPGQAQQAASARYAFADTTLLRDTLDLHFNGLFPAADSLQILPDSLRAMMIRYRLVIPRMSIVRLVQLADSLSMPVDSVGPVFQRERYNPLADRGTRQSLADFQYTSGYDIQRTTTTWTNGSQYHLVRGPTYLNNLTNIELQRFSSGGAITQRQNREATTEAGVTPSRNLSFGGRSYQLRFFSIDPGSPTTQDETKNEYSLTARAQRKTKSVVTEANLRSGWLDDHSTASIKRGFSGSADGKLRLQRGASFSHDLSGSLTGNLSRTRPSARAYELNTRDLSTNVRGNLAVLPNAPVGFNVNYAFRHTRVEQPLEIVRFDTTLAPLPARIDTINAVLVNSILNSARNGDATLRIRVDNDRYLNLSGNLTRSASPTGTRRDGGGKATLRWLLSVAALDANYSDTRATSIFLRQRNGGGYLERTLSRAADAQLVRTLGPRFVVRMISSIGLDQYRYVAQADSATPPSPRDAYRQQYRAELSYNASEKMTSGVVLQVSLNRAINLAASTTGSNNDVRSYRGEWRWNYRLFRSLTVTQNNQITADYTRYPFAPDRNTLSLNHSTITSLAAQLPGNFFIDVQHNTSRLPRGSYLREVDGLDYLQLSDDSRSYTLNTAIRYQPAPALGIHLEPRYQASERSGTVNSLQTKQRADKNLSFSGGVDLNWRVGRKGQLTGRVSRSYTDQRTVNYQGGIGNPTPRAETDFWNGNLQLSWTL
jgi:hypothetical protein